MVGTAELFTLIGVTVLAISRREVVDLSKAGRSSNTVTGSFLKPRSLSVVRAEFQAPAKPVLATHSHGSRIQTRSAGVHSDARTIALRMLRC